MSWTGMYGRTGVKFKCPSSIRMAGASKKKKKNSYFNWHNLIGLRTNSKRHLPLEKNLLRKYLITICFT